MNLAFPNVGAGKIADKRLLYVEGRKPTAILNLSLQAPTYSTNTRKLYILGPSQIKSSGIMNLFLKRHGVDAFGRMVAVPTVVTDDNMNLFAEGKRLFGSLTESKGVATVTFSGTPAVSATIVIVDTAGTSKTYTSASSTNEALNEFIHGFPGCVAGLKACIDHANGHGGTITVINNGAGQLTLTQTVAGVDTTVVSSLTNVTVSGFTGGSPSPMTLVIPNTIGPMSRTNTLHIRGHNI
jgi:hypothetical protein